jgi:hypothetical protein
MTFDMHYKKEYRKKYYIKNIEKFRNYYDDNKDRLAEYEKLYYIICIIIQIYIMNYSNKI